MSGYAPSSRDRIPAAIVAVALPGAMLFALIAGLGIHLDPDAGSPLSLFTVGPPPPPPPEQPEVRRRPSPSHRPEGAASPPNLRSRATDIVAPEIPLPTPPVVVTAPAPLLGNDASTGSAEVAGPGTGAGGVGNGLGSGGRGDGDGGGGEETPPEWRGGRLRDADFPDELRETTQGGTVGVRYTVLTSGRVANCRVTRSSGVAVLDALTCRLITARFRYRPSRDTAGRPVQADIVENHEWVNELTEADLMAPEPTVRRRRWF